MIQAWYPPKMCREITGRASITTTLDLYTHLHPGELASVPGQESPANPRGDSLPEEPRRGSVRVALGQPAGPLPYPG